MTLSPEEFQAKFHALRRFRTLMDQRSDLSVVLDDIPAEMMEHHFSTDLQRAIMTAAAAEMMLWQALMRELEDLVQQQVQGGEGP